MFNSDEMERILKRREYLSTKLGLSFFSEFVSNYTEYKEGAEVTKRNSFYTAPPAEIYNGDVAVVKEVVMIVYCRLDKTFERIE